MIFLHIGDWFLQLFSPFSFYVRYFLQTKYFPLIIPIHFFLSPIHFLKMPTFISRFVCLFVCFVLFRFVSVVMFCILFVCLFVALSHSSLLVYSLPYTFSVSIPVCIMVSPRHGYRHNLFSFLLVFSHL